MGCSNAKHNLEDALIVPRRLRRIARKTRHTVKTTEALRLLSTSTVFVCDMAGVLTAHDNRVNVLVFPGQDGEALDLPDTSRRRVWYNRPHHVTLMALCVCVGMTAHLEEEEDSDNDADDEELGGWSDGGGGADAAQHVSSAQLAVNTIAAVGGTSSVPTPGELAAATTAAAVAADTLDDAAAVAKRRQPPPRKKRPRVISIRKEDGLTALDLSQRRFDLDELGDAALTLPTMLEGALLKLLGYLTVDVKAVRRFARDFHVSSLDFVERSRSRAICLDRLNVLDGTPSGIPITYLEGRKKDHAVRKGGELSYATGPFGQRIVYSPPKTEAPFRVFVYGDMSYMLNLCDRYLDRNAQEKPLNNTEKRNIFRKITASGLGVAFAYEDLASMPANEHGKGTSRQSKHWEMDTRKRMVLICAAAVLDMPHPATGRALSKLRCAGVDVVACSPHNPDLAEAQLRKCRQSRGDEEAQWNGERRTGDYEDLDDDDDDDDGGGGGGGGIKGEGKDGEGGRRSKKLGDLVVVNAAKVEEVLPGDTALFCNVVSAERIDKEKQTEK
jgi:hypothetical protein